MANNEDNREETSPLLQQCQEAEKKTDEKHDSFKTGPTSPESPPSVPAIGKGYGWTADGLPLEHGSVLGEPMGRSLWNSSICACIGRNDEFCSSDLEVCLLGSVAPCVLYGSNAERLGSTPGTFANHCLTYSGLYFIGNTLFGWNCLAPWFSYASRTAIRRKFNLEGSCEALHRSCGCCGCFLEDEMQREQCESACDFATHVFCHACALCQEARELRRRLAHPGHNAQPPVLVMIQPAGQTMGREA